MPEPHVVVQPIGLTPSMLAKVFPFHVAFDADTRVVQVGTVLQRLLPDIGSGDSLGSHFRITRPVVALDFDAIRRHADQFFLVEANRQTGLTLKGQMLVLEEQRSIVFLCSPWVTRIQDLQALHLSLADFSIHDPVADYLFVLQTQATSLGDAMQVAEEVTALNQTLERRVTQRTRALTESNHELQKLTSALEQTADNVFITDTTGRIEYSNAAFQQLTGFRADEVIGHTPRILRSGAHNEPFYARLWHTVSSGNVFRGELVNKKKNGDVYCEEKTITPIRDATGTITHFVSTGRDVTERKRADRELAETQAKYRALVEGCQLGVYIIQDDRYVYVNPQMTELFGLTREELLALPSVTEAVSETDRAVAAGQMDRWMKGELKSSACMFQMRHADGHPLQIEVRAGCAEVAERPAIIGTMLDVTEREDTQNKLKSVGRQYRELFEEAPMMYVITRIECGRSVIKDCNHSFLTSLGYAREEVVEREMAEFSKPASREPGGFLGQARRDVSDQERQLLRSDGGVLQTLMRTVPLDAADGRPPGERVMFIDVSPWRKAEQEVHNLQAQLSQSQRVEAIGTLAGGIAHDFNNVLTAILGYSQEAIEQIDEDKPIYADLKEIQAAAQRAASLTRQLLTFSRQQVLNLVVTDMNRVVREIDQMLQRLIGEDVIVTTHLSPEECRIKADVTQMEQILVNLAVNARDAMPSGGSLTIETATVTLATARAADGATVPPGRYVRLSVSDTGSGMTPDTLAHLFEPFFTTKEKGKGTGLGLATVYGAVKQIGGFISVRSQLQKGTRFEILLPQRDDVVSQVAAKNQTGIDTGAGEVVLLVEDDPMVRKFSATVLARHGYRVLEAASADRALTLLDGYEDQIHLLLTDVVMPGMSGVDLGAIIETRRPGTKILFMSGYTGDLQKNVMQRGERLVEKPFSAAMLLRSIRRALDGDAARDADATPS